MKCREEARFEDIKLTELDHLRYRLRESLGSDEECPNMFGISTYGGDIP